MIAAGAVLTSGLAATPPADSIALASRIHMGLAGATGLSALAVFAGLLNTNTPAWVRGAGWALLGVYGADAALSGLRSRVALDPTLAIAHAALAPALMALFALLFVFTKVEWSIFAPEPADLSKMPKLPLAAKITPAIVLLQILLGAGYRHKAWGVMPHMAGAMLVALLLLVVPVILLQKLGEHPVLRPAAFAALVVALTQIALGIGAFLLRLLDLDTTTAFVALAAAHVSVGSLALAASVILAIQIALSGRTVAA